VAHGVLAGQDLDEGTEILDAADAAVATVLAQSRRRLYRPVVEIRDAIERYGAGDMTARAPERVPAELAAIARTFNQTGATLERQLHSMAAVAHDLRNPLSALGAAVSLLGPGRPLPPEERIHGIATLAGRQVARLDRMIGDLLDVARIEAGRLELRLEERDLREMASQVLELFRPSAPGHDLVLVQPEEPLIVRCDLARIDQAMTNLVSNAIKY
jgi:signal transduction histidine kinase